MDFKKYYHNHINFLSYKAMYNIRLPFQCHDQRNCLNEDIKAVKFQLEYEAL